MKIVPPSLHPLLLLLLLFFNGGLLPASALTEEERSRASELFAAYRVAIAGNHEEAASAAVKSLMDELPPAAAAIAHRQILSEAEVLARTYVRDVEAILVRDDPRSRLRDPQVVKDRALLAELLTIGNEGVQKTRLAEEGWPAIQRLNAALLSDPRQRIEASDTLREQRDGILFRLSLSDELAAHAGISGDSRVREQIEALESAGEGLAAIGTSSDKRVLTKNEKVAESATVPARDVVGANDANRLRMLAGLPALEIDPGLCKASLIHSQDMAEHGFFSHESPVPGRRTPWDRAAEAGTSANAENIASGQRDPAGANRSWFHSPGHFVNLFGNFSRIGFGGHGTHWTQLFGN